MNRNVLDSDPSFCAKYPISTKISLDLPKKLEKVHISPSKFILSVLYPPTKNVKIAPPPSPDVFEASLMSQVSEI